MGNISSLGPGLQPHCLQNCSLACRSFSDVRLQAQVDTLTTGPVSFLSKGPCGNFPQLPVEPPVPERGSLYARFMLFHFLCSKYGDLHQVKVRLTNGEQKETFSLLRHLCERGERE